jgi:hypothetical protein
MATSENAGFYTVERLEKWENVPTVDCSKLAGTKFTIHDIDRQSCESLYHSFRWRFLVEDMTGATFMFFMNPSNRRNKLIARLQQELPVRAMTLVEKSFTDVETGKLISYYDLENSTRFSGTISH